MVGHSLKIPDVGRLWQLFEPPPQFAAPEVPMRDAPIIRITVPTKKKGSVSLIHRIIKSTSPVTRGGKNLFKILGEQNDMPISRKEHIRDVPVQGKPLCPRADDKMTENSYREPFHMHQDKRRE